MCYVFAVVAPIKLCNRLDEKSSIIEEQSNETNQLREQVMKLQAEVDESKQLHAAVTSSYQALTNLQQHATEKIAELENNNSELLIQIDVCYLPFHAES